MTVVYDAGVLIAADRDDRRTWADHRRRLELGLSPVVTAPVVAQASRSIRQASLHRFLNSCTIVPFDPGEAHGVGALLARAGSANVVDAHLVVVASKHLGLVLTTDEGDVRRLADLLPVPVAVEPV